MKESEIKIKISLDENKVPEQIHWTAEDAGERDQKSEAVLISLWDAKQQNSLRIDLWTKEMKVDEMKTCMQQSRCWAHLELVPGTGAGSCYDPSWHNRP